LRPGVTWSIGKPTSMRSTEHCRAQCSEWTQRGVRCPQRYRSPAPLSVRAKVSSARSAGVVTGVDQYLRVSVSLCIKYSPTVSFMLCCVGARPAASGSDLSLRIHGELRAVCEASAIKRSRRSPDLSSLAAEPQDTSLLGSSQLVQKQAAVGSSGIAHCIPALRPIAVRISGWRQGTLHSDALVISGSARLPWTRSSSLHPHAASNGYELVCHDARVRPIMKLMFQTSPLL